MVYTIMVLYTHTRKCHTNCDNLPREICDNLPQRHFVYLQQDYRRHVSNIHIINQPTC